YSSDVTTLV
nr:Chain C, TYR-SER-SER-ASP-VAL-THR-THR-LEU-VAL [uncultured virus]